MKNRIVTKVFGILKDFLEKVLKQSAMTADERIRVSSRVLRTSSVSQKPPPQASRKNLTVSESIRLLLENSFLYKSFWDS